MENLLTDKQPTPDIAASSTLVDTRLMLELLDGRSAAGGRWAESQPAGQLSISSMTLAEVLAQAESSAQLHARFQQVFELVSNRILPFDGETARVFAALNQTAQADGRVLDASMGYVAATAILHGIAVATCDPQAYTALRVELIVVG